MSDGARSRRKGASGELEIAQLLREAGWPLARRTHDGREQAMRGDIAHGPAGFQIEVKRTERAEVWKWWEQALNDAGGFVGPLGETVVYDATPLVVFRRSRSPWLALIEFDELLPLLRLREL